ncbi:MAG: hypothetical protein DRG31_07610 [Deltaproteobacteria bacterium]|nr:MAG: hypothetical protein DRG31_07610 [Deltaproteobacteria bacterium]
MVQVIFEITYTCPCNCSFCPIKKLNLRGKLLPLTDYKRVLEVFRRYFDDDEYAAVLSGGEPGTVPFLKDYVDAARRLGYTVTVVTNAFNIGNTLNSRPDVIELSIDYFGEQHDRTRGVKGLFNNAMKLVALATRYGIPVVIRSTAMKDNIQDILELRRFLNSNGLSDVPILVMPVRGAPELKPNQHQLKELQSNDGIYVSDNCPAGISSFVITPELEILACIFYRKKLSKFMRFTKEELDEAIKEGAKIPRFPCER